MSINEIFLFICIGEKGVMGRENKVDGFGREKIRRGEERKKEDGREKGT